MLDIVLAKTFAKVPSSRHAIDPARSNGLPTPYLPCVFAKYEPREWIVVKCAVQVASKVPVLVDDCDDVELSKQRPRNNGNKPQSVPAMKYQNVVPILLLKHTATAIFLLIDTTPPGSVAVELPVVSVRVEWVVLPWRCRRPLDAIGADKGGPFRTNHLARQAARMFEFVSAQLFLLVAQCVAVATLSIDLTVVVLVGGQVFAEILGEFQRVPSFVILIVNYSLFLFISSFLGKRR